MSTATNTASPLLDNPARRIHPGWVGAVVLLALAAAYWPTLESIEAIWRRSETFAHGYVVVPIVLGLVWMRSRELALSAASPFWPALAVVAAAGFGWMLGNLAGVVALEQFSLYVMMVGAIVTVLGLTVSRQLAFPLAFLVFAVPFGEFMVPWLIDRTADFLVVALQVTGVPVYREGNNLIIPSGVWSVVDACSGVRYLTASVMVGALYAYLFYRSWRRRLAFVAASIVVPIVANWLRAYIIVMLGHLTDNRLATGVDHFLYGWVFFGIVIITMFWVGLRWREADPGARRAHPASARGPAAHALPVVAAAAIALVVGIAWRPLTAAVDARVEDTSGPLAAIPEAAGWQTAPGTARPWTPHYVGARSELHQWFAREGATVGVYVALYSGQTQGRELIEFRNELVVADDSEWKKVSETRQRIRWDGEDIVVKAATIAGDGVELSARAWYWINGRYTTSDAMAKALLAADRLLQRPDHSAVIVIYTQSTEGSAGDVQRLDRFALDVGPLVMQSLQRATAPPLP